MQDGRDGLWLVDVATGVLHPVVLGEDVGSANWSPDGRSLVAAVGTFSGDKNKPLNSRLGLYFIDLPDLDQLAPSSSE